MSKLVRIVLHSIFWIAFLAWAVWHDDFTWTGAGVMLGIPALFTVLYMVFASVIEEWKLWIGGAVVCFLVGGALAIGNGFMFSASSTWIFGGVMMAFITGILTMIRRW